MPETRRAPHAPGQKKMTRRRPEAGRCAAPSDRHRSSRPPHHGRPGTPQELAGRRATAKRMANSPARPAPRPQEPPQTHATTQRQLPVSDREEEERAWPPSSGQPASPWAAAASPAGPPTTWEERRSETPGARAAAASAASSSAAWPSMKASGRPSAAPPSEPEVTNISGASRDASASDPDIQKGKEKGRNAARCSTPLKVRARGTPATALRKRGECRIPGRERVKLVVLPLTCLTALHTHK